MKKYNALVFMMRGEPVHNAHVEIIKRAAMLADRVIVIIGSTDQPRTYKNPFTFEERQQMLLRYLSDHSIYNVVIEGNYDTVYNDQAWAKRVQKIVAQYEDENIGIIGHCKDSSSYYLRMFPQWTLEEVELIEPLNATDIRELYFRESVNYNFIKNVVPDSTLEFLKEFETTDSFEQIVAERKFAEKYKQQFAGLKYPPIFVTADTVVVCSGHVLLVKRKSLPGQGLMALPGGFLNSDELIEDCAIRELNEETKIEVPDAVLRGSIKRSRVFDYPARSSRGRTITHCFVIELHNGELPKVKGSDDALCARWIPLNEIKSENMFEDHWEIVQWAIGS